MRTVNNLMCDWNESFYKTYDDAAWLGVAPEPHEFKESDDIFKDLRTLVGGNFELPDNDFYHGLFVILDTARQLKHEKYVNEALIQLLYEYAPETVNVDDLVQDIEMEYLNNHQRDK